MTSDTATAGGGLPFGERESPPDALQAVIEDRLAPQLVPLRELRRRIHRYPELGFEERVTSDAVASYLEPLGLETRRGVGGTGIVAVLRGRGGSAAGGPRRTIALRADLDALPMEEKTGLDFASLVPGMMHACGHDMHCAILAGAAATLADLLRELEGDVVFIFQPAEESGAHHAVDVDRFKVHRRGQTGAERLIAEGVLRDPAPQAIVALHCWPDLPVGTVGLDPRVAMAGNGTLRVRIRGHGGHGAAPHRTVDPVPIAATVILALQTAVSRSNDPANPFVLSVTTVRAGTAINVIPDQVELQATLRSVKPGFIEDEAAPRLERLVRGIASAYGAECDVACGAGLPVTLNDPRLVRLGQSCAETALGPGRARLLEGLSMTSEDFSFFAQAVPGLYIKLGVAGPDGCEPLHSARFAPHEGALAVGVRLLVRLALDFCRTGLP